MGILQPPRRCEKILRNFDLLLPKFHFPVPWGIFVCSLEIPDFLGRHVTVVGTNGSCLAGWRPLCQIGTCNGCRDARSCVRCIKGYSVRCVKCYSVVVLTGTDAQIVRPYSRYTSLRSGTDALPLDTPVRPYISLPVRLAEPTQAHLARLLYF